MDDLELQHLTEIQTIEKMAEAFCTIEEIADVLDVNVDTLKECLEREPYASAFKRNRAKAKFRLRKSQMQLANENASMAKFLGTNELGQSDGRDDGNVSRHHHFHQHVHSLEERRESLLEKFDELAEDTEPAQLEHNDRVIEGDFSGKARSTGD